MRCASEGCKEIGTIEQVTLFEVGSTEENGIGERRYCVKCYDKLGNTYNENALMDHEYRKII